MNFAMTAIGPARLSWAAGLCTLLCLGNSWAEVTPAPSATPLPEVAQTLAAPASVPVAVPVASPVAPAVAAEPAGVVFDFQDADVRTVVEMMARMYGLIPILGDDVKGKINISVQRRLNLNEAYQVLSALLDVNGLTPIRTDKFLKVVSKREALQKPIEVYYGTDAAQLPDDDRVISLLIPIRNTKASTVLENLRQLVAATGNVFVNQDTNAIVMTDSASNVRRLLKLVTYLDARIDEAKKSTTRVYGMRYLKAKEMADALEKVFGSKDGKTELKVTTVEVTNTLVISADIGSFTAIEATITRLDTRRRQVLIEAQVIEVQLSNDLDFGIRLTDYLLRAGGAKVSMGKQVTSPQLAFTFSKAGNATAAVVEMLAKDNKVKILSAPHILTMDNQKAKIVVGEERPILKSSTALNTGTNTTVSDYVYKDVGLELSVTPRITEDRDVAMEVQQKVTDILETISFGSASAPVMGKREASTSVQVRDGHTLVIGGLIKTEIKDEEQKVPLLGDIPLLGKLFSNIHKVNHRTELLVFITPTVIETDQEGATLTQVKRQGMSPDFNATTTLPASKEAAKEAAK